MCPKFLSLATELALELGAQGFEHIFSATHSPKHRIELTVLHACFDRSCACCRVFMGRSKSVSAIHATNTVKERGVSLNIVASTHHAQHLV